MKVYISSPLSTDEQKFRINEVAKYIRDCGYEVFSPMEYVVPNAWDLDCITWSKKVQQHNLDGLNTSNVVVAIYDGLNSDTGSAFEIGYAYAKGIPVILLVTDVSIKQSLMITNASDIVGEFREYKTLWAAFVTSRVNINIEKTV